MLRHASRRAAEQSGWLGDSINAFVLGHGEARGERHEPVGAARFAYVPLPSLEYRGDGGVANVVGAVRRALMFVPSGNRHAEIAWAERHLPGCELIREHDEQPQALLTPAYSDDRVIRGYLEPSSVWATVIPVVLPGRDDRRRQKTERLLRKAIVQAGFSETLATHAEIAWRNVGFLPGADLASDYFAPSHLQNFPRFHVRITWRDPEGQAVRIPGPVVIGGGRYLGLGVFAGLADGRA
jgi:CRISPR-associated protein Csb2